jgi:UDP-glucose 4-epimerase
LASVHVHALRYLLSGGKSVCANVGTGRGHSVNEVRRAVEEVTGSRVPTRLSPRRTGDPSILVAEPARACASFGWTPTWLDIGKIVASSARWHQSRLRCASVCSNSGRQAFTN